MSRSSKIVHQWQRINDFFSQLCLVSLYIIALVKKKLTKKHFIIKKTTYSRASACVKNMKWKKDLIILGLNLVFEDCHVIILMFFFPSTEESLVQVRLRTQRKLSNTWPLLLPHPGPIVTQSLTFICRYVYWGKRSKIITTTVTNSASSSIHLN